jgi:hypothetical protein
MGAKNVDTLETKMLHMDQHVVYSDLRERIINLHRKRLINLHMSPILPILWPSALSSIIVSECLLTFMS